MPSVLRVTINCCSVLLLVLCLGVGLSLITSLPVACSLTGESRSDKRARATFLLDSTEDSPWKCARARYLRSTRVNKWSKHARHSKSWGRALRWLREFQGFAKAMCSSNNVNYDFGRCLRDDRLCCLFLTDVAEEMKGISRVIAARRALNTRRLRMHSPSLNNDHDITLLVDGIRRSQPKTRHQVESLDVNDVSLISTTLSTSARWQDRQLGVMIATGFLTIVRYGELQRVTRDGVRLIYKSGAEVVLSSAATLPDTDNLRGILIHLHFRKSNQDSDSWIPMSCRVTIERLLRHEQTLRDLGCPNHRLFPSVSRRSGQPPNPVNFFGATQFRDGLRRCLRDICHMSPQESMVYGGHSLRVGGSNYMRRLGVDRDVHRSMGGWATLKSATEYMQLSPSEQFDITRKLAVKTTREHAFASQGDAQRALDQLRQLTL